MELLERARKVAEQAEVFSASRQETEVLFEANRLKKVQARESRSLALRLIEGGRIGFAATNKAQDEPDLLAMALEVAPFGAPARFEMPPLGGYPPVEVYDPGVEAVTLEEMVGLGQSLIDRVRRHSPETQWEAAVTRGVTRVEVLNSRGGQASYKRSYFSIEVEGVLVRGTDMLFVGEGGFSCRPISSIDEVAGATLEQLEWAKELAPALQGSPPVVFTPHGIAHVLFPPLVVAFNGKAVVQGASPLAKRLGERAFDPRLFLWDDATLDYRPGSSPCDDEGVPSQRTPLIEGGVVADFLYDLQTAAQAGRRSTGSGRRAGGSPPAPATSSLIMGTGGVPFEEMLAEVKEGLVVERLIGAGQGNILSGDFGGNVLLGYKVERGRIVGRVKDTVISGNVYEVLKEVMAIGDKAKWVGGSLFLPPLCCGKVAVAAKR